MSYTSEQPMPTIEMKAGNPRNALNLPINAEGERAWSHSFFGCCSDCGLLCYTLWCPCIMHGKNRQRLRSLQESNSPDLDPSSVSGSCIAWAILAPLGLGCIPQCFNRGEVRARYGIQGSGCMDCLATHYCPHADMIQVSRELELEEKSLLGH
ncbi:HD domain-containing protein [Mycena chlorophos]|uniref:HD domain-containing protein n=1 Tax=Mycena chlorophos TaxID=658473 RepID=A0A8H6WH73_MYCCL|nr:HD domain-containing protein [Mycena chlorophos]